MVRFTLKRSLRDESCCNLLVVNGGVALRRRSFFSAERTTQSAFSSAARICSACSPLVTSIFSSPLPRNRASNAGGLAAARLASIVQYSFFSKALMSRSRSTIKRSATVCTRPAERPRRTLSHNRGETWYPRSRSSTRLVCCASTRLRSMSRGCSNAALTARCVISLKVTRRMRAPSPISSVFGLVFFPFFFLPGKDDVFGFEIVFDVDTEAAFGQVFHVAERSIDRESLAQILLDSFRLSRRFDND